MDRSGIYFFKLNISEFKFPRIPATEDLIRGYYKDEEEPVLWYPKAYYLTLMKYFQS